MCQAEHHTTIGMESHACIEIENHASLFFMVKMAGHMDCKSVHLTTTMMVHSMAAILQEIDQPRHAVLAYIY